MVSDRWYVNVLWLLSWYSDKTSPGISEREKYWALGFDCTIIFKEMLRFAKLSQKSRHFFFPQEKNNQTFFKKSIKKKDIQIHWILGKNQVLVIFFFLNLFYMFCRSNRNLKLAPQTGKTTQVDSNNEQGRGTYPWNYSGGAFLPTRGEFLFTSCDII